MTVIGGLAAASNQSEDKCFKGVLLATIFERPDSYKDGMSAHKRPSIVVHKITKSKLLFDQKMRYHLH